MIDPMLANHLIAVSMIGIILFLQMRNFVKYRLVNGANITRITLVCSVFFTLIHVLINWHNSVSFLNLAILSFGLVYLRDNSKS